MEIVCVCVCMHVYVCERVCAHVQVCHYNTKEK